MKEKCTIYPPSHFPLVQLSACAVFCHEIITILWVQCQKLHIRMIMMILILFKNVRFMVAVYAITFLEKSNTVENVEHLEN